MKYAIRFYSDVENPYSYPSDVIYESLIVPDDTSSPPEGYSSLMTDQERSDYLSAHSSSYDTYQTMLNNVTAFNQSRLIRRDGIKGRMDWGHNVVLDFRDYAVAKNINPTDSIALMSVLGQILPYLQLGLLSPAAYLLNSIGANSFLDGTMDLSAVGETGATITVKQYFINKILAGNV